MKARDIERKLSEQPVPPPPEGLVDRIKSEIPAELELSPEISDGGRILPFRRRRQVYLAAAAVLTLSLTAAITWQLRDSGPAPEAMWEAKKQAENEVPSDGSAARPVPYTAPLSEDDAERGRSSRRDAEGAETEEWAPSPPTTAGGERAQRQSAVSPGAVAGRGAALQEEVAREGARQQPAGPGVGDKKNAPISAAAPVDSLSATMANDRREAGKDEAEAQAPAEQRVFTDLIEVQIDELALESTTVESDAIADSAEAAPKRSEKRRAVAPRARRVAPTPEPNVKLQGAVSIVEPEPASAVAPPSTGGTEEPNDQPYGDNFFREYGVNPFLDTEDDALSTFGLEVDTGSYTVIRRHLRDGNLPPREAVRLEELINAFDYGDRPPRRDDFALAAEGAPSPFGEGERYYLLRFAVTARAVDEADRPPTTLIFVVDVSGSMDRENRLGLVKQSLQELLDHLRPDDRVGLVVYGSRGEVLLEPTTAHDRIRWAIQRLDAGGSTNAEEGLVLAYRLAEEYLESEGITRVILCSDGVANVGRTGPDSILGRIERSIERGIELTTVGFGMGNYNDVLMEQLADSGDGRYAYVDSLAEARRLFVEELTGTLMTVGFDTKAQIEFDPEVVSRYRLIGYENRDIADERFRDPTVDAGEIGAGHQVTALYEIKLQPDVRGRDTLATLRVRYRPSRDGRPVELERSIAVRELASRWRSASPGLKLASLVAEYGEILKGAYWAKDGDLREVLRQAQQLSPEFAGDARVADFVSLVAAAAELSEPAQPITR